MKKLYKFILCISLFLGSIGKVSQTGFAQEKDALNIVVTTTHLEDLIQQIGGDKVKVTTLMGPGVDPHGYEPTPSDVETLTQADYIFYNGLHLEAMFSKIFDGLQNSKEVIAVSDALDEEFLMSSDDDSLAYDPHIWFSVPNWITITEYASEELGRLDESNADFYRANAKEYINELIELDAYIRERVHEIPSESRYLITAHDAFNYFGKEYGMEVMGIQGLNTQTEAATNDFSRLTNLIVEKHVKAVFIESSVSSRNIDALVEAVKSKGQDLSIGGELYSDSLGAESEGTNTYITMYRKNIDTIVDGLK